MGDLRTMLPGSTSFFSVVLLAFVSQTTLAGEPFDTSTSTGEAVSPEPDFEVAVEAGLEGGKEARFKVTDILGNKAVRPIKVLTEESQSMQPRLLHVGETKDLSPARKQFYSETNP